MNYRITVIVLLTALLAGCSGRVFNAPTSTATQTASPLPPTATATVTPTPSITPTSEPTAIPTPTWVTQGPNSVQVPILLYHHILVSPSGSPFCVPVDPLCVPPDKFDDQLKLLHDWGYTTITTTMLVKGIMQGALLPPRPIILAFDDSNEDNYTNAFPIMKKYGFTGVLYVVGTYIDQPNYLTTDQIKEMAAAGWEVGSHTMTHQELTVMTDDQLHYEIVESRKYLEQQLGVPILTFAYPFGGENSGVVDYVHFAGYIAAMGAEGCNYVDNQGVSNLFDLQRCDIAGGEDAKTFIRFLPWLGDPSFLPTDTPTPTSTPSRTPIPTWTMYPTSTSWKATKTPTP
ncbi:MAG: polysaccharide deacetylase family protein [Anaerolineales bacterium]